jgi:hypothetical protein
MPGRDKVLVWKSRDVRDDMAKDAPVRLKGCEVKQPAELAVKLS